MKLPQDLLDEIFNLIYDEYDDNETLRACSLVEKSWVYPTQRLLFSCIDVDIGSYPPWEGRTGPGKAEPFDHTHSLFYFRSRHHGCDTLPRQLPPFRQLQTLTLSGPNFPKNFSQHLEVFSAFQHTLSSLTSDCVEISWPSCFAIVCYFPNLSDLDIISPCSGDDNEEPMVPSRRLHGRLRVDEVMYLTTFLDQLSSMQVAYDELEITREAIFWNTEGPDYQHLINMLFELHQYQRQNQTNTFPGNAVLDLQNCSELQELVLYRPYSCERLCATIASITSQNIHKILYDAVVSPLDADRRQALEDAMCGLVGRLRTLGYEDTPEVEFQLSPDAFDSIQDLCGDFFLKFREDGQLVISTLSGTKRVELSTTQPPSAFGDIL
ncbi:hypothetical protein BJ322DRAFT_1017500 [Thelephora terrestris]|uniref:Uncharacterized protein n=1 Tax=Thelephora terrestris TaxID=56493 RepID=A0A9P6HNI0_9AGAM|nr:hypothetical protein BJ322DRAFT_1017500 [Thelephora terrestris]